MFVILERGKYKLSVFRHARHRQTITTIKSVIHVGRTYRIYGDRRLISAFDNSEINAGIEVNQPPFLHLLPTEIK